MMNASAPISKDCKEFLQIVFACPVTEGYGLTESAGPALLSTAAQGAGAHVGLPIPQLEVCLVDAPDLNYTSRDTPAPRGEVCLRGPNILKVYFKDPAKTAEAIDADRWLHTGDIGKWNADGTLSIIDRKKNIFKLSQGEYVAPEKIKVRNRVNRKLLITSDGARCLRGLLGCVAVNEHERLREERILVTRFLSSEAVRDKYVLCPRTLTIYYSQYIALQSADTVVAPPSPCESYATTVDLEPPDELDQFE